MLLREIRVTSLISDVGISPTCVHDVCYYSARSIAHLPVVNCTYYTCAVNHTDSMALTLMD